MGKIKEILESYGVDYETTMQRFVENEAFYVKILNKLPKDNSLQILGNALEEGDLGKAFEAAHALKGVTGNLGLTFLYQAVCEIVEPLRAKEERTDYPKLYQAVQREYERALQMMKELDIQEQ